MLYWDPQGNRIGTAIFDYLKEMMGGNGGGGMLVYFTYLFVCCFFCV
jgi:hypothetical protein